MNELKDALLENPSPGQDDVCPEMWLAEMQKSSEALSFPGVAHAAPRCEQTPHVSPRGLFSAKAPTEPICALRNQRSHRTDRPQ